MSTLLKYAPEIHAITKSKGFWDEGEQRNKGEMVMLIISELGECLEAHRENNWAAILEYSDFDYWHRVEGSTISKNIGLEKNNMWPGWFKQYIKSTVEDELADAVIRILDYVTGWNIPVITREYRKDSTGNFGHDLLRINWYILNAYHEQEAIEKFTKYHRDKGFPGEIPKSTTGKDWGYVLAAIEKFAEWYKIDLEQHVQWKMKYNSTRPHKHNKAY